MPAIVAFTWINSCVCMEKGIVKSDGVKYVSEVVNKSMISIGQVRLILKFD